MEHATPILSIVQGASTVILVIITWHYVRLTKQLVHLQIEPRLDFSIPSGILHDSGAQARLLNNSGCSIDSVKLQASVGYRQSDGTASPVMRCVDTQDWNSVIRPKMGVSFDLPKYFSLATEIGAEHDIPKGMEFMKGLVILSVSFRRTADGKEFCFQEPYSVIPQDDGKATVSKSGPRQHLDSLDRCILRRKES
jgi:hypothetical protein